MKLRHPRLPASGFTLIEVLVAMLVIALGIGALLTTLTSSANSVTHLRDKSFAEWIALNRISEVRLSASRPGPGVTTGDTDYAGAKWRWRQEVIDQDVAGILRIDVAVARATDESAADTEPGDEFPSLAKAYGFIGTDTGAPNGIDPTWSLPPLPPRGTP
jgi:general secretion pathway protein I